MKRFSAILAGLALAGAVQAAPLFYDNFNLPGGTFENWASHFDQSNGVAANRFTIGSGRCRSTRLPLIIFRRPWISATA